MTGVMNRLTIIVLLVVGMLAESGIVLGYLAWQFPPELIVATEETEGYHTFFESGFCEGYRQAQSEFENVVIPTACFGEQGRPDHEYEILEEFPEEVRP